MISLVGKKHSEDIKQLLLQFVHVDLFDEFGRGLRVFNLFYNLLESFRLLKLLSITCLTWAVADLHGIRSRIRFFGLNLLLILSQNLLYFCLVFICNVRFIRVSCFAFFVSRWRHRSVDRSIRANVGIRTIIRDRRAIQIRLYLSLLELGLILFTLEFGLLFFLFLFNNTRCSLKTERVLSVIGFLISINRSKDKCLHDSEHLIDEFLCDVTRFA